MQSGIELRPATRADAGFLAGGFDEAAGGLFAAMLGRDYRSILTRVIAQPEHQFSYEHAIVAVEGFARLGFSLGWPSGTPGAAMALVRAAGRRLPRLAAVALVGWPVLGAMNRHADGEWYLQTLAVVPAARGRGVGRSLVADALERAVSVGCAVFTLDVEDGNTRALGLYESLGLRIASTSSPAPALGDARAHRMELSLAGARGGGGAAAV